MGSARKRPFARTTPAAAWTEGRNYSGVFFAAWRARERSVSMEYRRLGRSGLEVSIVCLGTMMFGDRTDTAESNAIIADAFDAGVNFIDTADVYVNGASETITGAAIRAERARWILATKVGNVIAGDGNKPPRTGGSSRRWIF